MAENSSWKPDEDDDEEEVNETVSIRNFRSQVQVLTIAGIQIGQRCSSFCY